MNLLTMIDEKEPHPFVTGRLCPIYCAVIWALIWYVFLVLLGPS